MSKTFLICFAIVTMSAFSSVNADDAIKTQILKLFPQADTNGDGVISDAEEAVVWQQALKRRPQIDKDGDGVLSDAEKQALLRMAAKRAKPQPATPTVETPTHAHVSYGPEDRQWLNLYLPSGSEPAPVFIYAHHNGSTADDVQSSWADPTVAAGTAIVSWESIAKVKGMADFQTCAADAKVMFAWVKENVATYNFDIDKIFIGGQSRGSFVSWELAHIKDAGIAGIYMGQALPGQSFNERLLEPITKNAPPIFLAYRKEPGVVGDIHDPAHGLRVVDRYKELGIGDRAKLVHSLNDTSDNHVMQFVPKFVRSLVLKWNTIGFQQANSMGGGAAAIPTSGKFRVFVLMGQSNMNGSGRATELDSPYNEKHDRIRIWANGGWEYLVPSNKFGPGVSLAHQLADFWPDDTIGIIKVSCGATGISAFEKNWSFERAERSKDGNKGSLYKDLMNAVAEAKRISQPEFCGFVWKQGAADGKKGLAEEYYDNFNQLILDLNADLGVSNLPTFVPSYAKDKELLKAMLPYLNNEQTLEARKSAGEGPVDDEKFLHAVLSYIDDNDLLQTAKPAVKKQRYLATVISAQNRAGRELPNVTTLYPGKLPIGDGVHYSSEGYLMLGKITASAVEEFYKAKE